MVQDLITQFTSGGIRDERLLQAMAAVPRENFIDEALTQSLRQCCAADWLQADYLPAVYGG